MKIKCPKCNEEFSLASTETGKDSIILKLKTKNGVFKAETIGRVIINTTKVFQEIGKDIGQKVDVLLQDFKLNENEVSINFLILPKAKK